MTNYEWLVKTGKLQKFIRDVETANEGCEEVFNKEYGTHLKWGDRLSAKLAEWLQAEHKKTCVALNDVMNILEKPICFNDEQSLLSEIHERINKIKELPTTEIY